MAVTSGLLIARPTQSTGSGNQPSVSSPQGGGNNGLLINRSGAILPSVQQNAPVQVSQPQNQFSIGGAFNQIKSFFSNVIGVTQKAPEVGIVNLARQAFDATNAKISQLQAQYDKQQLKIQSNPLTQRQTESGGSAKLRFGSVSEDLYQLEKSKQVYDQVINNQTDQNFVQGFLKGLKEFRFAPFVGSLIDTQRGFTQLAVAEKMARNEPLSQAEEAVAETLKAKAFEPYTNRNLGYQVAQVMAGIPEFAAEFVLSGGLFSAGKAGATKAIQKVALPAIVEKYTVKVIGNLAGSVTQTTLGFSPRISAKTAEYMLPKAAFVQDEKGQTSLSLLDKKGDSFEKALAKAFGSTFLEVATERTGVIVEKPLDFLKKAVFGRWIASKGITTPTMLEKLAKAANWDGIIGEVFEEELSELGQAPIEEREYNNPFTTPEGFERLIVETLGIAGFGGIGTISNTALKQAEKQIAKTTPLNDRTVIEETKKQVAQIIATPEEASGVIVNDPEFAKTPEGKEVLKTVAQAQSTGMDIAMSTDEQGKLKLEIVPKMVRNGEVVANTDQNVPTGTAPDFTPPANAPLPVEGFSNQTPSTGQNDATIPQPVTQTESLKVPTGTIIVTDDGKIAKVIAGNNQSNSDQIRIQISQETQDRVWPSNRIRIATQEEIKQFNQSKQSATIKPNGKEKRSSQDLQDQNDKTKKRQNVKSEIKRKRQSSPAKVQSNEVKQKTKPSYRGTHTAPIEGASLDNLTGNDIYPNDIYSASAARLYSSGNETADAKAFQIVEQFKDQPNKTLTIYRAVPKDAPDKINRGDWVTITREYAILHGESNLEEGFKILTATVKASDIRTDGNSIQEWAYNPTRIPSGGYASTGATKLGSFEEVKESQSEASNFKLHEEIKKLVEKYARMVGEGYKPRGALGVYYPDTKGIRINGMNDLSVASHEITHFLDRNNKISDALLVKKGVSKSGSPIYAEGTSGLRKEITDLYIKYYPGGRKTHKLQLRAIEGFATLLQKYVEMPTQIEKEYPNLVKAFLKPGGKYYNPVMSEIIADLRGIIGKYQSLSALDKIGARLTSNNAVYDKDSFLNFGDKFKSFVSDNVFPFEKLDQLSGKSWTSDSISLWTRMFSNAPAIISTNLLGKRGFWNLGANGDFVKTSKYNWADLVKGLEKEKRMDSFANYLVARDQHFDWLDLDADKKRFTEAMAVLKAVKATDPDIVDTPEFAKQVKEAMALKKQIEDQQKVLDNNGFTRQEVDDAYEQNKADYTKEEELFDQLNQESLKMLLHPKVQLIDQELFDKLTSKKGYASLKRQFYDELAGEDVVPAGVIKVGKTRVSSLLSRSGSQRAIVNPVYSGMFNHAEVVRKSLKQIVYNQIGKIGISAQFPDLFQRLQLEPSVDRLGRITYPQEKDPKIIMTRVNYKRVPILTDNILKKTVDEILTYQNVDWFSQILLHSNRMFTKGTTSTFLPFTLTNFFLDQITAVAQTRNNYVPVIGGLKTMGEVLLKTSPEDGGYFNEYMALGGERQTLVGMYAQSPNEFFQSIAKEKRGLAKVISALETGIDLAAVPAKYSEIATRVTEYIKSRKAGNSQVVALEEAGRVTAPFHHVGSFGGSQLAKTWIRGIPFLNAGIQVVTQAAESSTSKKGRMRYGFVALAVLASTVGAFAYTMANASDDQREQYKDMNPSDFARYIFIPKPSGKGFYKLRIPEQIGAFTGVINMILAEQMMNIDYTVGDYLLTGTQFLPSQINFFEIFSGAKTNDQVLANALSKVAEWMPQLIKPAFMVGFNVTDFPNVHPLEGQHYQALPAELRFNKSTTALAKKLGELTGFSPIKVDYLITGYFGRATGILTGKPGALNPLTVFNQEYYVQSGRRIQDYYNSKDLNDQQYKAMKDGLKTYSQEEKNKIATDRAIYNVVEKQMKIFDLVDPEKDPVNSAKVRNSIMYLLSQIK